MVLLAVALDACRNGSGEWSAEMDGDWRSLDLGWVMFVAACALMVVSFFGGLATEAWSKGDVAVACIEAGMEWDGRSCTKP